MSGWALLGLGIDILSGALFVALGAWVLTVRPRRRVTLAFGVFSIAYGLVFVLLNLGPDYLAVLGPPASQAQAALNLVWAAALAFVALRIPRPLGRRDARGILAAAGLAAVVLVATTMLMTHDVRPEGTFTGGLDGPWAAFFVVTDNVGYSAFAFFLLAMALRRDGPEGSAPAARLTLALVPYYGLLFGAIGLLTLRAADPPGNVAGNFAFLAVLPVCGIVWLARAHRAAGDGRKWARRAGLASFLFPAAGTLAAAVLGDAIYTSGLLGLSRMAGVAVLAYAILRTQLFDLDLRVKATLRRGAVAACFLGVFLIVEQVVQALAGEAWGAVTGGAAAGLLLFGLHPLQRWSQRLADAAMPKAHEAAPEHERKLEAYRAAYASAWADGILSRDEMQFLAGLRGRLGLSAAACARLEQEWMRQA